MTVIYVNVIVLWQNFVMHKCYALSPLNAIYFIESEIVKWMDG